MCPVRAQRLQKADIEPRLVALMVEKGWQFKRLCKLCAAFVRDLPVTPYFRPRVVKRWPGTYQIEGYIGVIHQKYESERPKPEIRPPGGHFPCNALNIGDLKPLAEVQYVREMAFEKNLSDFVETVAALLEAMPQDAAALRAAFDRNELLGVPFESFALFERRPEFAALRDFVRRETAH